MKKVDCIFVIAVTFMLCAAAYFAHAIHLENYFTETKPEIERAPKIIVFICDKLTRECRREENVSNQIS